MEPSDLEPMRIPRHVHQFWCNAEASDSTVPEDVLGISNKWLEIEEDGHWKYTRWDHAKTEQLIERELGVLERRLFANCLIPAMRADIARLVVIWVYGGLYADLRLRLCGDSKQERMQNLDGLDKLLATHSPRFIGFKAPANPGLISNALFAAPPRSAILWRSIKRCFVLINDPSPRHADVWWLTGRRIHCEVLQSQKAKSDECVVLEREFVCEFMASYKRTGLTWQSLQRKGIYYDTASLPFGSE